jgi:hypothetical protein
MHRLKIAVPTTIVAAGMLLSVSVSYGTPEYAKKEKKACSNCHAKMVTDKKEMAKNLNDTGTCYKENEHSLAKCPPAKK